jgi:hypothetical protein
MDARCTSKTSVDFQRTTQRYIPGDETLHNHCCENLRSCSLSDVYNLLRCCFDCRICVQLHCKIIVNTTKIQTVHFPEISLVFSLDYVYSARRIEGIEITGHECITVWIDKSDWPVSLLGRLYHRGRNQVSTWQEFSENNIIGLTLYNTHGSLHFSLLLACLCVYLQYKINAFTCY